MSPASAASGFSCAVVGCGNIGGFLAPLLVRMGAASLVLIDPDSFEHKNIAGQDIAAADVGQPKVAVLAEKLRRINPRVHVVARCEPVEHTPLGLLRVGLVFGCLDSRLARQTVNECCWRVSVPLVDAGLDATMMMVRVDVHVPGRTGCVECNWSAATYNVLETAQPCQVGASTAPTNAPGFLGAIAASLQASAAEALLRDGVEGATGERITLGLHPHRHQVTSYELRSDCRFDHQQLRLELLDVDPALLSVGDTLFRYGAHGIRVPGAAFARTLICAECGFQLDVMQIHGRSGIEQCPSCATDMLVRGMDTVDVLHASELSVHEADISLQQLGVRHHDVISVVTEQGERHLVLGPPHEGSIPCRT